MNKATEKEIEFIRGLGTYGMLSETKSLSFSLKGLELRREVIDVFGSTAERNRGMVALFCMGGITIQAVANRFGLTLDYARKVLLRKNEFLPPSYLLSEYIEAAGRRADWGKIKRDLVMREAKTLLSRAQRREGQ